MVDYCILTITTTNSTSLLHHHRILPKANTHVAPQRIPRRARPLNDIRHEDKLPRIAYSETFCSLATTIFLRYDQPGSQVSPVYMVEILLIRHLSS